MSDLRRCDQCGTEAPVNQDVNWLHLSRSQLGLYALSFDDHPGPWDFCSWACVAAYAQARIPVSEDDVREFAGMADKAVEDIEDSQQRFEALMCEPQHRPWWKRRSLT